MEVLVIPALFLAAVFFGMWFSRDKHDEFETEKFIYEQFEEVYRNEG